MLMCVQIYKQGDKTDIGNYRTISILSSFSKIIEKLICRRTYTYSEKYSILLPNQYGFKPAYSATHAMIDVFTISLDNLNLNKNTALILLDLKTAFDTESHEILLSKLLHYSF